MEMMMSRLRITVHCKSTWSQSEDAVSSCRRCWAVESRVQFPPSSQDGEAAELWQLSDWNTFISLLLLLLSHLFAAALVSIETYVLQLLWLLSSVIKVCWLLFFMLPKLWIFLILTHYFLVVVVCINIFKLQKNLMKLSTSLQHFYVVFVDIKLHSKHMWPLVVMREVTNRGCIFMVFHKVLDWDEFWSLSTCYLQATSWATGHSEGWCSHGKNSSQPDETTEWNWKTWPIHSCGLGLS